MVICQYFLKGTCKFGNACFNEHRYPADYAPGTSEVRHFSHLPYLGRSYGKSPLSSNTRTDETTLLAEKIQQDLVEAPLWPFSCYGIPAVNEHLLTGDISMEEVMFEAKKMKFSNQYESFQRELYSNIQSSLQKRAALPSSVISTNNPMPALATIPFPGQTQQFSTQNAASNPFGQQVPLPASNQPAPVTYDASINPFQNQNQNQAFQNAPSNFSSMSVGTPFSNFSTGSTSQGAFGNISQPASNLMAPALNGQGFTTNPQTFQSTLAQNAVTGGIPATFLGPLSGSLPQLTQSQRQAFDASSFLPGQIPDLPPH